MNRPDRTEAADYYFTYIDQVPDGDILQILEAQGPELMSVLNGISEEQSLYRYAPDKWTIRDVVAHVSDAERVFAFRALWFARELGASLPSFDQDIAARTAGANDRPWRELVDELGAVRASTLAFFRGLPGDAWPRRGIASEKPFTVRALAYICAGHAAHHLRLLRERYLH